MLHLRQTASCAAVSQSPSEPEAYLRAGEIEVVAVAGKDVEQSDCCLDTSRLWQTSLLLPVMTSEGWWLHLVDIRVSEEKHLAPPVAAQPLQKHWPLQCPLQPGVLPQVQHGLKVPVKRNRQRWAVEMGVASQVHHCRHAPQRRLGCHQNIACRSVCWTAAAVAEWCRPGLSHQRERCLAC